MLTRLPVRLHMRKSACAGVAKKIASPSQHEPNLQPMVTRAAECRAYSSERVRCQPRKRASSRDPYREAPSPGPPAHGGQEDGRSGERYICREVRWRNASDDFSFASSDFKALGAFFCNNQASFHIKIGIIGDFSLDFNRLQWFSNQKSSFTPSFVPPKPGPQGGARPARTRERALAYAVAANNSQRPGRPLSS